MILLIDNYDSFVFNLARYFERLGARTEVVRNDAIDVESIGQLRPAGIVLSPGPCTPHEAGVSLDVVRQLHGEFPMLGVCLGHQTIAAALGGRVVRAESPMHGRASEITHDAAGIFTGLPVPLRVGRYHSLVVEPSSLPASLASTAWTADGVLMALCHREFPIFGVQFHPESILTDHGYQILANFLTLTEGPAPHPIQTSEHAPPSRKPPPLPTRPVTF